jgi:LysR family glycine cleavage system transcriptional activator
MYREPVPELPPLGAARVFEVAARHLSFTAAAKELGVTQAAVSHQIKALEDWLGLRLFRRLPRRLLLTDEGQTYARALREVFDRLAAATTRITSGAGRTILTVSVVPSFGARWLVPRLGRFQAAHPGIDVRVAPSLLPADFGRDGVDVAIRFGHGRYTGLRTDELLRDEMFPVCAPALRHGPKGLRRPADLARFTLLHDEAHDDWARWLRLAGQSGVDAARGPIFTDASMLLQAAIEGQGVALGRRVLAEAELGAGRLVRPFPESLPVDRRYFVVSPEMRADEPKIAAFRTWVMAEAQAARKGGGGDADAAGPRLTRRRRAATPRSPRPRAPGGRARR